MWIKQQCYASIECLKEVAKKTWVLLLRFWFLDYARREERRKCQDPTVMGLNVNIDLWITGCLWADEETSPRQEERIQG
jgi:hypothetical protein